MSTYHQIAVRKSVFTKLQQCKKLYLGDKAKDDSITMSNNALLDKMADYVILNHVKWNPHRIRYKSSRIFLQWLWNKGGLGILLVASHCSDFFYSLSLNHDTNLWFYWTIIDKWWNSHAKISPHGTFSYVRMFNMQKDNCPTTEKRIVLSWLLSYTTKIVMG